MEPEASGSKVIGSILIPNDLLLQALIRSPAAVGIQPFHRCQICLNRTCCEHSTTKLKITGPVVEFQKIFSDYILFGPRNRENSQRAGDAETEANRPGAQAHGDVNTLDSQSGAIIDPTAEASNLNTEPDDVAILAKGKVATETGAGSSRIEAKSGSGTRPSSYLGANTGLQSIDVPASEPRPNVGSNAIGQQPTQAVRPEPQPQPDVGLPTVVSSPRRINRPKPGCSYCYSNRESERFYLTHVIRIGEVTTCPVLRKYVCRICHATGDHAHTERYCPTQGPPQPLRRRVLDSCGTKRHILRY